MQDYNQQANDIITAGTCLMTVYRLHRDLLLIVYRLHRDLLLIVYRLNWVRILNISSSLYWPLFISTSNWILDLIISGLYLMMIALLTLILTGKDGLMVVSTLVALIRVYKRKKNIADCKLVCTK